jgi:hypothetical protein
MLEKVLFAGVKTYEQVAASGVATVTFTVPVLTHSLNCASNFLLNLFYLVIQINN